MPANSRKIVKEVNNTTHLDEALSLVVKRSRSSMGADACSVYIYDTQTDRFILMAVDGVMSDEVGKAQVSPNDGLVGWVAAHEEVINLSNAADHPGFDLVSKTGDESRVRDDAMIIPAVQEDAQTDGNQARMIGRNGCCE